MLFNKRQRILLLSAPLLFSACSDDVITDATDDSDKEAPEVIVPVDFRYLTLNNEGSCGEAPSVSFIHQNATVFPDYYNQVNGSQILPDPNATLQLKDKVFLAYGSNWNDNGIVKLNANTFVKEQELNLGTAMIPYAIEWLGGDSIFVAGRYKDDETNAFVASIKDKPVLTRKVDMGFTVRKLKRTGGKLFALGTKDNFNGEALTPLILVADIKNISNNGFRVIGEGYHLSSRYSDLCVDKNGNIWFAADKGGYKLFCIDTKTEKIIHTVDMPYSITTLNELAYTISNDGKVVYLRYHKAFYTIDVDNPQTLDEPVYEYRKHVGQLNDLKITKEGNLLFIDQNMSCSSPSAVVEVKPQAGEWSLVSETTVGMVSKSIFVAKYEK